jgi:hypothetical protein
MSIGLDIAKVVVSAKMSNTFYTLHYIFMNTEWKQEIELTKGYLAVKDDQETTKIYFRPKSGDNSTLIELGGEDLLAFIQAITGCWGARKGGMHQWP